VGERVGSCFDTGVSAARKRRGFAVVDSVIALLVMASSLALTITASQVARKAALAADEMRRADRVLNYLVERAAGFSGRRSGQMSGLLWQVDVSSDSVILAQSETRLCRLTFRVQSQASGRVFTASTERFCTEGQSL
jgi:hypothetical protein